MIQTSKLKVVLDTNVIYPIVIRDILFWFAHYELYSPKWSNDIFDEWRNVMERKGISKIDATTRVHKANLAFPDALVHNYEEIVQGLNLPDPKDCHVLAAAIKINAAIIVTNNLKDFPEHYLKTFGIKVKSADEFLTDIIDLNREEALMAFREMVTYKKKPELSEYQVIELLRKGGLNNTADYLHTLL